MSEPSAAVAASSSNIYQRINRVRETNEYIQKKKDVDGKYKVVTHDQVTSEVRRDLIKHGIVIVPVLYEGNTVQETGMKTSKGVPIVRFEGIFDVAFVNVDKPEDKVYCRVPAHALDTGDKAPGKAVSYAVKMAMLKMFSIETGEEDEERREREAAGDEIDAKSFSDWLAKIGELSGKTRDEIDAGAQKIWEHIHEQVAVKLQDPKSATKLRAYLTSRVTVLRKMVAK